jgi:hypothetical protein
MSKESSEEKQSRFRNIFKELNMLYPEAHCALDFTTPFELHARLAFRRNVTMSGSILLCAISARDFPISKSLAGEF